jgi:hypothetical protein
MPTYYKRQPVPAQHVEGTFLNMAAQRRSRGVDLPEACLRSTFLLDLDDPRLRMRASSLTQLSLNDCAKALAIYAYVKRLPYTRPFKMGHRTARDVLDSGMGDGPDKATLMISLLRHAGVPARMRIVRMDGQIMRGLVDQLESISWPFVEVWLDGRWIGTDTYIFDAPYMAAARQALKDSGQQFGFGVYVNTQAALDGAGERIAFASASKVGPHGAGGYGRVPRSRPLHGLPRLSLAALAPRQVPTLEFAGAQDSGGDPSPAPIGSRL